MVCRSPRQSSSMKGIASPTCKTTNFRRHLRPVSRPTDQRGCTRVAAVAAADEIGVQRRLQSTQIHRRAAAQPISLRPAYLAVAG
eukprot:2394199-Pleurochrysis_carterae.AAC.2